MHATKWGSLDGDESDALYFPTRGWSMRYGHRRRLAAPKRGKAALKAEIQGQGKEVFRGRAIFKRSVNPTRTNYYDCYHYEHKDAVHKAKVRCHQDAFNELAEVVAHEATQVDGCICMTCWRHDVDWCDNWDVEEEWEQATVEAKTVERSPYFFVSKAVDDSDWLSETCSNPSTALDDWEITSSCTLSFASSEVEVDFTTCTNATNRLFLDAREPTLWELAVARAAMVAATYLGGAAVATGPGRRNIGRKAQKEDDFTRLLRVLRKDYDTHVRARELRSGRPFDEFRRQFLEKYGEAVSRNLRSVFTRCISLRPLGLADHVSKEFLANCNCKWAARIPDSVRPAFHGTNVKNIPSICHRGLLIPGSRSGVKVVNGSAHGVGIYTARVGAPHLSWGFCRGIQKQMLVCAVIDDAAFISNAFLAGRFLVTKQSEYVRHVGDAMVVFDQTRVAPLFLASQTTSTRPTVAYTSFPFIKLIERYGDYRKHKSDPRRSPLISRRTPSISDPVIAHLSRRAAKKRRK